MKYFLYILSLIFGIFLGGYGLYCLWFLKDYIGSGHYWSNPWFYKSNAALAGMIILRIFQSGYKVQKMDKNP